MVDTAANLVDRILPVVPVRQWVCSLPWRLRYLLGYDKKLCADLLTAFVQEVMRSLRFRAKRLLRRGGARRGLARRARRTTDAEAHHPTCR